MQAPQAVRALYLEPFHGGSHGAFGETLMARVPFDWHAITLPARHWKWRMRGVAPWLALAHGATLAQPWDLVFASSFVPLAELMGLTPSLAQVPKVLYFHENQLSYPLRPDLPEAEVRRDHHFGVTQLVSALAADCCAFNSAHNRDAFLAAARALLKRMPDANPPGWVDAIAAKSAVWPVPLDLPHRPPNLSQPSDSERKLGPIILWNHRWEHDKRPDRFFAALQGLVDAEIPFRVAICGQRYRRWPAVFDTARAALGARVLQWGPLESRADYEALLARAHIALSTADHEFFGIAMLEAAHFGAYPLVPDALAYPELFPAEFRYREPAELSARLASLCRGWVAGDPLRADRRSLTDPFGAAYIPTLERSLRSVVEGVAIKRKMR